MELKPTKSMMQLKNSPKYLSHLEVRFILFISLFFLSYLIAVEVHADSFIDRESVGNISNNLDQNSMVNEIFDKDYIIKSLDKINVTVKQDDKLKGTYDLDANGFMSFPLLDKILVTNMTISQLESLLHEKLKEKYFHNPTVRVTVSVKRYFTFDILGGVVNPGTYEGSSGFSLLDAIYVAGGLSEKGDENSITLQIKSKTNNDLKKTEKKYSLKSLYGNENISPILFGGETIVVSEILPISIKGPVIKPGEFYVKSPTSLRKVLGLTGGLLEKADVNTIKIIFNSKDGVYEKIFDLEKISRNQQVEPMINPGDNIIVDECISRYKFFNKIYCKK